MIWLNLLIFHTRWNSCPTKFQSLPIIFYTFSMFRSTTVTYKLQRPWSRVTWQTTFLKKTTRGVARDGSGCYIFHQWIFNGWLSAPHVQKLGACLCSWGGDESIMKYLSTVYTGFSPLNPRHRAYFKCQ